MLLSITHHVPQAAMYTLIGFAASAKTSQMCLCNKCLHTVNEHHARVENVFMHDPCVFPVEYVYVSQQRLIKLCLHETYLYGGQPMISC